MRAGYLWLASFLAFPLVGVPLLTHPAFRRFGFFTRLVLSTGVGMVLTSWTMTLFAVSSLRWGPPALVLIAAAVAFALRLLLRGDEEVHPSPPGRGDGGEGADRATRLIASSLTGLSVLAALLATIAGRSTSTDLLLFWGTKAQQFAAARTVDVDFLRAPLHEYLHIYYPPFVTNVYAFGAMVAGRFPWGAAILTFPILLAATGIGLAGILERDSGAARGTATAALTTSAIALLGIHALVAGNADPFLLFFEILAVALLVTRFSASTAGKLLAGLLFAGAAAAKVEGLPFLVAAVGLFLLVERERRGHVGKALLLLTGPTVVSLTTWFAFGATRRLFYGYQSYGRFLDVRWDHFGQVMSGFGAAFWKAGYALPFLVPLLVMLLTRGKTRRALVPIGITAALSGFLLFTYLHGDVDPTLWIRWSAARVFSPLPVLFALSAWCSRRTGSEE